MSLPVFSYTMSANLIASPFTPVTWLVYGSPDMTGAQSGYFGAINNITVTSVSQVTFPNNIQVIDANSIQSVLVASSAAAISPGQALVAAAQPDGSIQLVPTNIGPNPPVGTTLAYVVSSGGPPGNNSPYTALATDSLILVDTEAGNVTVNLPAVPSPGEKHQVKWWNNGEGSPRVTVSGNGNNLESWPTPGGESDAGPTTTIGSVGGAATWEWVATLNGEVVNAWVLGPVVLGDVLAPVITAFGADLAGSNASDQWLASMTGPGGTPGHIPLNSASTIVQLQGGTALVPVASVPLLFQPTDTVTKEPFGWSLQGTKFNSTFDYVLTYGYNPSSAGTEPTATFCIEQDYEQTPGVHTIEMYWQIFGSGDVHPIRPFFMTWNRSTGLTTTVAAFQTGGSFYIQDYATGVIQAEWTDGNLEFMPGAAAPYSIDFSGTTTLTSASDFELIATAGNIAIEQGGGKSLTVLSDQWSLGPASGGTVVQFFANPSFYGFYPASDDTGNLGNASQRWKVIYGVTVEGPGGAFSPNGLQLSATSGALSVAAPLVLTAAEIATPVIQLTGVVGAGGSSVTLPNNVGAVYLFDLTNVTLTGNLTFTTGSGVTAVIAAADVAGGRKGVTIFVSAVHSVCAA